MIIYIDLVILSTILVNYSFIKLIYIINNLHYSKIRLFVSTVVSTFSIILFFIPFKYISIIRHLYGIVVGIVAFKINSLKITIKMITSFYILNYLFIGTLVIFKIDKLIYLLIILIFTIILYIFEKLKINKSYIIKTKISDHILTTLIDTGNKCNYNNIPVSFLKKRFYNEEFIKIGRILTKCINEEILVDIYIGPLIKVNEQDKICYYAFVDISNYDCIISEELGG